MHRTEHCKIVIYGSDTVCHKCNRVWDTGYDADIACPYVAEPKPQKGRSPLPGAIVAAITVLGVLLALYNAIRWLG